MRFEIGLGTIWICPGSFSMRCNWHLAKTQFGIVFQYFRSDVIGIWLGQILEL